MRMRNPFSDEPGDEEKGSDDAPAEAERAEETRESEGAQTTEARADEDSQATASDEPQAEEPEAEGDSSAEADDAQASNGGGTEGSDDGESSSSGSGGGGDGGEASMTAAPSIGPNTVIDRKPPEERLDHDKISDVDAVGKDKRREVVGGRYGPSRTRVIATFATFFAVVAALGVGFYFLAKELDQPPSENPDISPWSAPEAPQQPPKPLQ
jgi:hypothetical protein